MMSLYATLLSIVINYFLAFLYENLSADDFQSDASVTGWLKYLQLFIPVTSSTSRNLSVIYIDTVVAVQEHYDSVFDMKDCLLHVDFNDIKTICSKFNLEIKRHLFSIQNAKELLLFTSAWRLYFD